MGGSVSIADESQTYFSKHVSWTSDLCSQQTSRSVSPHGCRIRIPNLTLPKPNYFSSLYTLLKQTNSSPALSPSQKMTVPTYCCLSHLGQLFLPSPPFLHPYFQSISQYRINSFLFLLQLSFWSKGPLSLAGLLKELPNQSLDCPPLFSTQQTEFC